MKISFALGLVCMLAMAAAAQTTSPRIAVWPKNIEYGLKEENVLDNGQTETRTYASVETEGLLYRPAEQYIFTATKPGTLTILQSSLGISLPNLLRSKGISISILEAKTETAAIAIELIGSRGTIVDTLHLVGGQGRLVWPTGYWALVGRPFLPKEQYRFRFQIPANVEMALPDIMLEGFGKGPEPIIDSLGQRLDVDWPDKVERLTDMQIAYADERQKLMQGGDEAFEPTRDSIVGTGFFKLAPIGNGQMGLFDPKGNPFWSTGVTGVRLGTKYNCTELSTATLPLFQGLAPRGSLAWENERNYSHYARNVERKYPNVAAWQDLTAARLKYYGYNTLGNWSDTGLIHRRLLPYTLPLATVNIKVPKLKCGLPEIYAKGFADSLVRSWKPTLARYANDSLLIGYFVDNELPWNKLAPWEEDKSTPTYRAWEAYLRPILKKMPKSRKRKRNKELRLSNEKIGVEFAKMGFLQQWSAAYFGAVKKAIAATDKNHLYLGCRFTRNIPSQPILEGAKAFVDVHSINLYQIVPSLADTLAMRSGKPVMVGEFHFQMESPNHVKPHYKTFSPEEVSKMRENYFTYLQGKPWCVGAHWYQWVDQEPTGRPGNGENQAVGLVDITDRWKDE